MEDETFDKMEEAPLESMLFLPSYDPPDLFVGQEFDSFESFDGAVASYSHKNCVSFYRRHSRTMEACKKRLPEKNFVNLDLRYGELTYACIHGGKKFTSHSKGLRPSRLGTQQIECQAHIRAKLSPDASRLVIAKMVEDHNHPLYRVSVAGAAHERLQGTATVSARRRGKLGNLSIVAQREIPRILVDTDAGVDGAGALFMVLEAHRQGRLNITAITSTFGSSSLSNANKNVLRVLQAADMLQIPVFSGAQSPLLQPHHRSSNPRYGSDGFGDTRLPHPHPGKFLKRKPAAVRIVEDARFYKGRLRVLALGPLTNLALAKKMEPSLLCQLASLHIMGGNTTGEGNETSCGEFNFVCDPEAAQIVLSDDRDDHDEDTHTAHSDDDGSVATEVLEPCIVYITPWETCISAVHVLKSYREELGASMTPQAQLLNLGEAATLSKSSDDYWLTSDQLAAAWMLDTLMGDVILPEEERGSYAPLAQQTVECRVTVELQGHHTRGQMVLDRRNAISYSLPATLLTHVNQSNYERYLRMAFGGKF